MTDTNADIVRRAFEAFQTRQRGVFEGLLADEFAFTSPHDPDLDKQGYFERCWPNMRHMRAQELDRVVEAGDGVRVRSEVVQTPGDPFPTTQPFSRSDGKIPCV